MSPFGAGFSHPGSPLIGQGCVDRTGDEWGSAVQTIVAGGTPAHQAWVPGVHGIASPESGCESVAAGRRAQQGRFMPIGLLTVYWQAKFGHLERQTRSRRHENPLHCNGLRAEPPRGFEPRTYALRAPLPSDFLHGSCSATGHFPMELRDSLRGAGLSAGYEQGLDNSSTGSSRDAILTAFGATSQSRVSGFPSIIVQ